MSTGSHARRQREPRKGRRAPRQATAERLRALGHRVVVGTGGYGGYQAIRRDPRTGVLTGASESRKDGQAAGY